MERKFKLGNRVRVKDCQWARSERVVGRYGKVIQFGGKRMPSTYLIEYETGKKRPDHYYVHELDPA